MSIARRKHAAIGAKLLHLRGELERWRALTERDGLPLARHWTQVSAVTLSLDTAVDELEAGLGRVGGSDAQVVEACSALQSQLLDIHRAWEYFRSKLAQRFVTELQSFLVATDELAWECYWPAQEAANLGGDGLTLREPPLTFLNGGVSPFLLVRGESFAAAIGDDGVRNQRVRMLVEVLPVPVIGVPWHHLRHVPDSVVVAHETGHAVEEDLGLSQAVRELIGGAVGNDERACAWDAWASEVFADVYATLTLGPAYAGALAEFVASGRRAVVTASPSPAAWGAYPPPTLRVVLSAEVCRRGGCKTAANGLVDDWFEAYPDHTLGDWEADAAAIAKALVGSPYARLDKCPLDSAMRFDPAAWAAAKDDATRLLGSGTLVGTGARELVAAARVAFAREPERYAANVQCDTKILERIDQYSDTSRRRGRSLPPSFAARKRAVDDRVQAVLTQPATTTKGAT